MGLYANVCRLDNLGFLFVNRVFLTWLSVFGAISCGLPPFSFRYLRLHFLSDLARVESSSFCTRRYIFSQLMLLKSTTCTLYYILNTEDNFYYSKTRQSSRRCTQHQAQHGPRSGSTSNRHPFPKVRPPWALPLEPPLPALAAPWESESQTQVPREAWALAWSRWA